jgi:PadR family transcriptional regulator
MRGMDVVGSQLLTHLRRGTLEYCVLAVLARGEQYALDLIETLGAEGILVTSQGTVYPMMARLHREGLVDVSLRNSSSGPPRRYFRLTPLGETALATFRVQWNQFRNAVDSILSERESS